MFLVKDGVPPPNFTLHNTITPGPAPTGGHQINRTGSPLTDPPRPHETYSPPCYPPPSSPLSQTSQTSQNGAIPHRVRPHQHSSDAPLLLPLYLTPIIVQCQPVPALSTRTLEHKPPLTTFSCLAPFRNRNRNKNTTAPTPTPTPTPTRLTDKWNRLLSHLLQQTARGTVEAHHSPASFLLASGRGCSHHRSHPRTICL